MFAENRKISIRQLQMLLLLDCFGTAVLFLPAELAEISGRGCFFAALLGGLGVSAASLLLTAVGRRMPNGTVVDWCRSVCGNGIGTILLLGLAGKILLDGCLNCGFSAKLSAVLCSLQRLSGCFPWCCFWSQVRLRRRERNVGEERRKSSFFWSQFPCFWCFWRWRLLRGMRVFCRLPCLLLRASGQGLQR